MQLPSEYMKWDVFISYASEDRETVARPLAHMLDEQGLKVWYDEFALKVGDSLSETIGAGLRESRFGVVILSPNFVSKKWTQNELGALLALETKGAKRILPVWHQVTDIDIKNFNPILADRWALSTSEGIYALAYNLKNTLNENSTQIGVNDGLDGVWLGLSGRLKLKTFASGIVGDYDWFGAQWVGTIQGSTSDKIFKFDWQWSLTEDRGKGFFRRLEVENRGGLATHLVGAWLYQADESKLDEVIQEYQYIFDREYYYELPTDLDRWNPPEIIHPWAFALRNPYRP